MTCNMITQISWQDFRQIYVYGYLFDTLRIGRFTAVWWIKIFLDP